MLCGCLESHPRFDDQSIKLPASMQCTQRMQALTSARVESDDAKLVLLSNQLQTALASEKSAVKEAAALREQLASQAGQKVMLTGCVSPDRGTPGPTKSFQQ